MRPQKPILEERILLALSTIWVALSILYLVFQYKVVIIDKTKSFKSYDQLIFWLLNVTISLLSIYTLLTKSFRRLIAVEIIIVIIIGMTFSGYGKNNDTNYYFILLGPNLAVVVSVTAIIMWFTIFVIAYKIWFYHFENQTLEDNEIHHYKLVPKYSN